MTALTCGSCGTPLRPNAKFCDECGTPTTTATASAEYKQVTVLFADVVHSMDIAAAVGPERLRDIMSELLRRSTDVVRRYGGTVDKFTGDGVMALFGAPTALEDHAVRACLAALDIHREAGDLAQEVKRRDGTRLDLRVGLNSGRVIAGAVGSGPLSYTAIGEQVGMAQRMESVAPPGGVMLSESTSRLVERWAVLAEPELVRIKGRDDPVAARRLLRVERQRPDRVEARLVGRRWEMTALDGMLQRVLQGRGALVTLTGPAGIGKSRIAREFAATAAGRGVDVFTALAESHATDIPFTVVRRLLYSLTGIRGLDAESARAKLDNAVLECDEQDRLLLDDLLGIRDPATALPAVDPDARQRRLSALITRMVRQRTRPALYVVGDTQWMDPISESMLAELPAVIPKTRSMLLITYRPEYRGALAGVPHAQSLALGELSDSESAALMTELLGTDPSVAEVASMIAARASGNPFFAEEMVRDLHGRDVLQGQPGGYLCTTPITDVDVPATVQAAIAARIDRLPAPAKKTLSAAAAVGERFTVDLLESLDIEPVLDHLVEAEFIDEVIHRQLQYGLVGLAPPGEYIFHQPLIRAVAYEAQLKSERDELHRRLARVIQARNPDAVDAYAALIAEHLEAAGDLRDAYRWHMRAGSWSAQRDIAAARLSWQRARQVADRLPAAEPKALAMRIAPRSALCGTAWLVGGSVSDTGFDELQELSRQAGDDRSLAIGMLGLLMARTLHNEFREAARLASDYIALLESIGDPTLLIGQAAIVAKTEAGEMREALRISERVIELAAGDPARGSLVVGSPLALAMAMRGVIKCCLGMAGWREEADKAVALAHQADAISYVMAITYKYVPVQFGAITLDDRSLEDTAEALRIAEESGDNFTVGFARYTRGLVLIHHDGLDSADSERGFAQLAAVRELSTQQRLSMTMLPAIDTYFARRKARDGDLDGAIELSRTVVDGLYAAGGMFPLGMTVGEFVELLLRRGETNDLSEASAAVERLAAVPTDDGFVLHELPLLRLRALLARAEGDEARYREYAKNYRDFADSLGFKGHLALAAAML
jgi:adenylate cyclase